MRLEWDQKEVIRIFLKINSICISNKWSITLNLKLSERYHKKQELKNNKYKKQVAIDYSIKRQIKKV